MSRFYKKEPFNDLPLLPPGVDMETVPVLKKCISTSRALSELRHMINYIPNPSVLINSIPLQEAMASSEIENIFTTTDALFKAAALPESWDIDPAVKETLRYRQALKFGFDNLKGAGLTVELVCKICSILKDQDMQIRDDKAVISDGVNIKYTPPVGVDRLAGLLENWESFIRESELDPLIVMAMMHYQFEAIHPFSDGNGRSGRILNILYLMYVGILDLPILYLSSYIIQNKSEYYRKLHKVTTKGEWESWILFMLDALEQTAVGTIQKISNIFDLQRRTVEVCKELSIPQEIALVVLNQPYCRVKDIVNAGIAQRQTASVYLKKLVGAGVLEEMKEGREKLFISTEFIHILSERENYQK